LLVRQTQEHYEENVEHEVEEEENDIFMVVVFVFPNTVIFIVHFLFKIRMRKS